MVFPRLYLPVSQNRPCKQMFCLLFALLLLVNRLNAQPLTEQLSLEFGLKHSEFTTLLDEIHSASEADMRSARLWPNPSLQISREQAGSETETSFVLQQTFDFSGERNLKSQASQKQLEVTEIKNRLMRIQRSADIQRRFYQVLHWQRQQQTLQYWIDKFSNVEITMTKREAAGDVSGYDLRRISQEKIALLAQLGEINAELVAAWEQLRGFFPSDYDPAFDSVSGELLPDNPVPFHEVLETIQQNAELLLQEYTVELFKLNIKTINRSQIPDLTLGIGHKSIDTPGEELSGLMLSASFPLPVFNRKQGELQKAKAELQIENQKLLLARQQMLANIKSHWHKTRLLLENANNFSEQSKSTSELISIAEASYQAGELGVLELIDAYRSNLQTDTKALQLAFQARLSKINFDQISSGVTR